MEMNLMKLQQVSISLLLLLMAFLVSACSSRHLPTIATVATSPTAQADNIDDSSINVEVDDPKSWIATTAPLNKAYDISPNTRSISIVFNQSMNPQSLNTQTIQIVSGKETALLQDLYTFSFDAKSNTLTLTFKNPDSAYGSSDGIDVFVSKEVENVKGEKMGVNVHWGFSTH